MDVAQLLTTTRSAREAPDLNAPVEADVIRECSRVAMQAAHGSNQQSWRWLVISDPGHDLRPRTSGQKRRAVPRRGSAASSCPS